jgi:hypothetical protein
MVNGPALSVCDVVIDDELKGLCPPLTDDERLQLMKRFTALATWKSWRT